MVNQYLQVIWIKKPCRVMNKEFTLDKKQQAYNWFERMNNSQIVLRGANYEPSFTIDMLEKPFDLWIYGTYKERLTKFLEWLNEMLEITKEVENKKGE